ncbi:RAB6-interacting golgin [Bacillus rossius redtenbacheri]|uniref:RAB6-interacting golgin n=1 Tax=Bacillus rossius redtenbacheri TaxID=93214 RepID=UPI002FDD3E90
MAGKWNGFTEDDIKKLHDRELGSTRREDPVPGGEVRVAKRQARLLPGPGRKNVTRERMLQAPQQDALVTGSKEDVPEKAFLSRPEKTAGESKNKSVHLENSAGTVDMTSAVSIVAATEGSPAHTEGPLLVEGGGIEGPEQEPGGGKGLSCSLDEFRERQRLMEEQNRQRKQLLSQALADRKKRTKEEARHLQQIQDELQKLDHLLSNDVSILRNHIENASIEFMEAQKRYDKAEKEFLAAKLVLFGKLERKELLTGHLCQIIEQNELRKARKLSELMDKLELGVTVQQPQPPGDASTVPAQLRPGGCSEEQTAVSQKAEDNTQEEEQILP